VAQPKISRGRSQVTPVFENVVLPHRSAAYNLARRLVADSPKLLNLPNDFVTIIFFVAKPDCLESCAQGPE
jgi:hypothetical protein